MSPGSPDRPRALVLMPRTPWPQDDGGRVVLWQDLKALARGFEVRVVILVPAGTPPPEVPAPVSALGVAIDFVEHRFPSQPAALWRGMAGRWPYTLARFHSAEAARALRRIAERFRPDLAFINNLHLATYADELGETVKVLRQQNLEQLFLQRYARAARNPAVAAYAHLQAGRMRQSEAELCARMDLILAMHEEEAAAIRAFTPGVRVEGVPVSAEFPAVPRREPGSEPTLLVIGSFDRQPNADGALRFVREGWPAVRRGLPRARLRIVGRQIPAELAAAARGDGAEPVGFVPDLASEFARAWGLVIPLWCGAGIRVKMVEAIAAGVPVVCTPLGAEGLGLEAGRHHLEAETGAQLGEAALSLLTAPLEAAARARAAREATLVQYETEAVAARTLELCRAALAERSAAR